MCAKVGRAGASIMAHNFAERLAYSEHDDDESFWLDAYRQYFPDMVTQTPIRRDCLAQRLGMDRLIVLQSGATVAIDEKKRAENWKDVLLEYIANDRSGAPGWIEKDLQIDYIAYAFMPSHKVYLLNWLLLRRAWKLNKTLWLRQYKPVPAQNDGYVTWSLPVPLGTLFYALNQAVLVVVPPEVTP